MPFKIGDKKIPFNGINDESDGFDAAEGTFSVLNNYIPSSKTSSLVPRGGFILTNAYSTIYTYPVVGNGGITANLNTSLGDMTVVKVLHVGQLRVTKPSDQVVTVMAAVCRFNTNLAGTTYTYMLRFFMNPSVSGGAFGAATTWKDVTPYYIDLAIYGEEFTTAASSTLFTLPYTGVNGGIYSPDLYGAYIYLEDPTIFTKPNAHYAEGDLCIANTGTYYASNTNTIGVKTENTHGAADTFQDWTAAAFTTAGNIDWIRIHKNLETGKINYSDLCSTTSTFFDSYSFSSFNINEKFCISVVSSKDSGRASFTLQLDYVKKTFFSGSGSNIFSKADFTYNGQDWIYDRAFVYGFPNYSNIVKTGATTFDGKTLSQWDNIAGTIIGGGGAATTTGDTIAANGYDRIAGRFKTNGGTFVTANTPNVFWKIHDCDVSISVDDFLMSEFDVHGRYGEWANFSNHDSVKSVCANVGLIPSFVYGTLAAGYDQKKCRNFPEFYSGEYDSVTNTNKTFKRDDHLFVSVMAEYDEYRSGLHDFRRQLIGQNDSRKSLGAVPYVPANFNRNITKIRLAINKKSTNRISSFTIGAGGALYTSPPRVVLSGGNPDLDAIIESKSYDIYANFRGQRASLVQTETPSGTALVESTVSAGAVSGIGVVFGGRGYETAPTVGFERAASDTTGNGAAATANMYNDDPAWSEFDIASGKTVYQDDLGSGWNFFGFMNGIGLLALGGRDELSHVYTKVVTIGKEDYETQNLSGSHLSVTGNPAAYGDDPCALSGKNAADITLMPKTTITTGGSGRLTPNLSTIIKKDFSFGAKSSVVVRERLFLSNVKFQEYQCGSIYSDILENNSDVFFSPMAEFGATYHIFDANTLKIPAKEISPITGLAVINIPQGLDSATQPDKNNLLVLGEAGYKYVDLSDGDPANWRSVVYFGDACVARKSVVSENGLVFCAGMNGIYMFQGANKVDITRLGKSSIRKSWLALSRTVKQGAIGCYVKDKKWYTVTLPTAPGKIYVFDIENLRIFTFSSGDGGLLQYNINQMFNDGKWYLFNYDGRWFSYDESGYRDILFDPAGTSQVCSFTTNRMTPSDGMIKADSFGMRYTGHYLTPTTLTVGNEYSSYSPPNIPINPGSGFAYYVSKIKRAFLSRGSAFYLSGTTTLTTNTHEINEIEMTFAQVPQKKMIRGL